MASRQVQAAFMTCLLLSAQSSRQSPEMIGQLSAADDHAGKARAQQQDSDNDVATVLTPEKKVAHQEALAGRTASLAATGSLVESAWHERMTPCNEFCVTCPAKTDPDTGETVEISWHVRRKKGDLVTLAGGVLATGLVTLGVASGVLVVPVAIAGAAAVVGISATTAMVGGGLAGAYLVRDFVKENRKCPTVEFLEVNKANNNRWKNDKAEEKYLLDDLNVLELMSQMKDVNNESWIQDYERNQNVPEEERLTGLMACNLLRLDKSKWGDMQFQDPNYRKMLGMFRNSKGEPSSITATIAECSKWLCAKKFSDDDFKSTAVKEMGSNWHGMGSCGERSGIWNWWRF